MLSHIGIRLKLFLSFLLLVGVISVVFTISSYNRITNTMNRAAQRHGVDVIKTFSQLAAQYIFESDYVTISDIANQLIEDSDIKFITITDSKGEIWLSTKDNSNDFPMADQFYSSVLSDKTIAYRNINQNGKDSIEFVYPISAIGRVVYLVIVEVSLDTINEATAKRIRETVVIAICMILFSSLIAYSLAKLLTGPIEKLLYGTNELAQGNLSYRVNVTSSDEIGVLSTSFNSMTEQLEKESSSRKNAERKLKEHGDNLERMVQERTAELAEMNEELKREILERKLIEEERANLESQFQQSKKIESIGVLAGGIAHDFNNILSAILGNIELASYHVQNDVQAVSLLSAAQKATKRAAKLTQQLLTFSKGGDPHKAITSLPELITESTNFVLHGSHVSCKYTFQENLWMANIDSGQVSQVMQNITLNAKQAMPEGGIINIRCDNVKDVSELPLSMHEGNYVRITIQDAGDGIPEGIMDMIFDPYFSTKLEGNGLGLSICYSIINKHDGHITVQSSPGKGTIFTIYLPAEPSKDITVVKQEKSKSAVKAARIMVMDDEEMIRNLAQVQLETLGHEAVMVVDGEQAINKYRELQNSSTPVDLVILDLTIPGGMGGQEAAQQLLQIDPEANIIVASGYSNDPVMANYREYGFSAAVTKPFDLADLRKGIDSALS